LIFDIPILLIKLIPYLIKDLFLNFTKKDKKLHLYGIHGYVGLYGQGKTIALTQYAYNLRKKYGDKIYIASNYFLSFQDFAIEHWQQLLEDYDKPIVFLYDEIQNDFNSRLYKDFPMVLVYILTQNRKGNGKQICFSAQEFTAVDKNFRDLTMTVNVCHTYFGRLTTVHRFSKRDYDEYSSCVSSDKRMKVRSRNIWRFVQSDYIRSCYDSFKVLENARLKKYMSRDELAKLNF
jgi:hypothetical protein